MHAELRFGDTVVHLGEAMPGSLDAPPHDGAVSSSLTIWCDDVDELHARAVADAWLAGMSG